MKTIIELPCSVGDTVWARSWWYGEAGKWKPWIITNLTCTLNKKGKWTKKFRAMQVMYNRTTCIGITLNFEDIGVKAFL